MLKRTLSLLLCVVMVLSVFTIAMGINNSTKAATTSQLNIDARANYLYNITWTCQKTVAGWNGNYYFYQGSTYRLPYGQPINSGYYILL